MNSFKSMIFTSLLVHDLSDSTGYAWGECDPVDCQKMEVLKNTLKRCWLKGKSNCPSTSPTPWKQD